MSGLHGKIEKYIEMWEGQGYPEGIPEEVPLRLTQLNLAPSYKAIAMVILKNDHCCKGLGFSSTSLFS